MIPGADPEDDVAEEPPRSLWPFDILAICLIAVCMAILIGVSAGVVWLRVFGPA